MPGEARDYRERWECYEYPPSAHKSTEQLANLYSNSWPKETVTLAFHLLEWA